MFLYRTQLDTHTHPVCFLSATDYLVAEAAQMANIHVLSGIRIRDPSIRAAADRKATGAGM